ncbi:MAG: type II secretion system protein [Eubacteriales bacterium]
MKKRGFTIIELLVVVVILGILLGIMTTAAASAVKQAREHKANVLCACVQQGLATYYAQKDRWPGSVGDRIANGSLGSKSNEEGANSQTDPNKYILDGTEVRNMIKALIDETKKGNPLMDISGLYVSRDSGEPGRRGFGLDFTDAIHGTQHSRKKMSTSEMYFGYPERERGYFRRFKITYAIPVDEMKVGKQ